MKKGPIEQKERQETAKGLKEARKAWAKILKERLNND